MKKKLIIGIVGLFCAAKSGAAFAGDDKTISALTCIHRGGGNQVIDSAGRSMNSGTSTMRLLCPIVRDDTAGFINFLSVSVLDVNNSSRSSGGDVGCRLAAVNRSSPGVVAWGPTAYSSASNTGAYQILGVQNPGSDYDYGAFILDCAVPTTSPNGQSGIVSWYYGED